MQVKIKRKEICGQVKVHAFVTFKKKEMASKAIEKLHKYNFQASFHAHFLFIILHFLIHSQLNLGHGSLFVFIFHFPPYYVIFLLWYCYEERKWEKHKRNRGE